MKKLLISLLAAIVAATAIQTNAQTVVQAQTDAATVFLNGAQLKQTAKLQLKKGEQEIRIEGLSPLANRQSIQVTLPEGVVLTNFAYSIDVLSADKNNPKTQALNDSLKKVNQQIVATEADIQSYNNMISMLQKGIEASITSTEKPATAQQIEQSLNFFQQRHQKLSADKQNAEQRLSELSNLRNSLNQRIKQESTKNSHKTGVLVLNINTAKATNCNADIKYFTSGASWEPYYDINVPTVGGQVQFALKARVWQTTGFDWNKTNLTLSTGSPSLNNRVPEYSSAWVLSQQQPIVRYKASNTLVSYKMADAMVVEEMSAEPMLARATMEDYVEVADQAISKEYLINIPYSILGNGKKQTIALEQKQANETEYTYCIVPKLDPTAFLIVNISNWEQLQLLEAQANITSQNTYCGQTVLSTSSIEDALKLTLGSDQDIQVKREEILEQTHTKTSGKEKKVTKAYRITVKNNKQRAVNIQVEEQYPISTTKEIKVELSDKTSSPTEKDTNKGILKYNAMLQPGQSVEYTIIYNVSYPKDWTVRI